MPRPEGWDIEFAKRMLLIAVDVVPEHKAAVDATLNTRLERFRYELHTDQLIDDIEDAMRMTLTKCHRVGWIRLIA